MSIYQHFRPEEKEFIDAALNWKKQVQDTYAPKLTDFLDPRQQQILLAILGKNNDMQCKIFGGTDSVERARALIYPEYFHPEEEDLQIALYEISYPKKFMTIEHRHVLGTLMSLGIKREKFGDIIIRDERVQFVVAQEIESFISLNLEKIGNSKVALKKLPLHMILESKEQWFEQIITVSSLRLDVILSSVYNISRQKGQAYISAGKVKLNFKLTEKLTEECQEGDTISARGLGRCKIISIEGKTKKDKWKVRIGKKK